MALQELFTRKDLPAYYYTVALDGINYTISLKFNDRMNKWMITLGDSEGNDIVSNVPVVVNWPLFDRFRFDGIPPGTVYAYDTSGQNLDPERDELGDRVRLFYLPVADL